MIEKIKNRAHHLLKKSEKYTKTDMIYLAKGGFWLGIGQIAASGSSLILAIVFANMLPKETFGTYKYVLSIIGILSITSLSGIDTAVTQAVARGHDGSFMKGVLIKMRWGMIGSFISLAFALYYFSQSNIQLAASFGIAGVFIPFMNSLNLYGAYLNGKKYFREYSLYNNVWSQIGSVIIIIATIFYTKNILFLLFIYFLSNTLLNLLFFYITINKYPPNDAEDPATVTYAKHLSFIDFMNTIAAQMDRILIFHFLGAVDLAIYTVAVAPTDQIKSVFKNVGSLAMPKFATRSKEDIRSTIFVKLFKFAGIITLSVFAYIICAPFLFHIFFPKYLGSIAYSQIIALSVVAASMSTFLDSIFKAHAMKKEIYQYNTWNNITSILLMSVFIYYWGLWGAIIARCVSRFILLFLSVSLVKKM